MAGVLGVPRELLFLLRQLLFRIDEVARSPAEVVARRPLLILLIKDGLVLNRFLTTPFLVVLALPLLQADVVESAVHLLRHGLNVTVKLPAVVFVDVRQLHLADRLCVLLAVPRSCPLRVVVVGVGRAALFWQQIDIGTILEILYEFHGVADRTDLFHLLFDDAFNDWLDSAGGCLDQLPRRGRKTPRRHLYNFKSFLLRFVCTLSIESCLLVDYVHLFKEALDVDVGIQCLEAVHEALQPYL